MTDDDREYYQGLTDEFYDQFVERAVDGRELDPETVRETEARLYTGTDALAVGLVDELGTRADAEASLADELEAVVSVRGSEPERGLGERLRGSATRLATAFGAGVAAAVVGGDRSPVRPR